MPGTADSYNHKVDNQILHHQVIERFGEAHKTSVTKQEVKRICDKTDTEVRQYMKAAEKKC